jgi:hypothetical protein
MATAAVVLTSVAEPAPEMSSEPETIQRPRTSGSYCGGLSHSARQ